jgi:hypothetical protein
MGMASLRKLISAISRCSDFVRFLFRCLMNLQRQRCYDAYERGHFVYLERSAWHNGRIF